ncbi:MAG: type II toxin-antitoxin system RelE/ParE family toxin [Candidatus Micrarchaeia archaeon]
MELESTPIFDKDIKKLDKHGRKELKDLIDKISRQPEMGKPMEHCSNVFSKRTIHHRLIWKVKKQENVILLLMYKNRDEVYGALRNLKF